MRRLASPRRTCRLGERGRRGEGRGRREGGEKGRGQCSSERDVHVVGKKGAYIHVYTCTCTCTVCTHMYMYMYMCYVYTQCT